MMPDGKVENFRSTNARQDLKHLRTARFWDKGGVKTGATLFDRGEMEVGSVSYCLSLVRADGQVMIRDGREVHNVDELREGIAKVWVTVFAVTDPPTRI